MLILKLIDINCNRISIEKQNKKVLEEVSEFFEEVEQHRRTGNNKEKLLEEGFDAIRSILTELREHCSKQEIINYCLKHNKKMLEKYKKKD